MKFLANPKRASGPVLAGGWAQPFNPVCFAPEGAVALARPTAADSVPPPHRAAALPHAMGRSRAKEAGS